MSWEFTPVERWDTFEIGRQKWNAGMQWLSISGITVPSGFNYIPEPTEDVTGSGYVLLNYPDIHWGLLELYYTKIEVDNLLSDFSVIEKIENGNLTTWQMSCPDGPDVIVATQITP